MEQQHQLAVAQLSRSLRSRYEQEVPFSSVGSISSGSSGDLKKTSSIESTFSSLSLNKSLPPFASILKIDPTRPTIIVEPNVTFEQLVNATLKYNLIPRFVSRFPQTTVGTAFTTTSVESSSFRHGLFHQSVTGIELVLQNGEVKRASPRENSDLFYGFVNTRSTLGTLTLLEIRLMPTAPFVEISYLPVSSATDAITLLNSVVHDEPFTYIDCILFSSDRGVVMVGRSTTDRNVYPIRRLQRPSDPHFYKHADACLTKALKGKEGHTELIPITDYLFRYASGVFWLTNLTFSSPSAGSTTSPTSTRFKASLTDPSTRIRRAHGLLTTGGLSQRIFATDVAVPLSSDSSSPAETVLSHIATNLSIYPLHLTPASGTSTAPFHTWQRTSTWPLQTRQMLLNIGVYGSPGPKTRLGIINNNSGPEYTEAFVAANRALEAKVREVGGVKWWTGPVFCSEDEFWEGLEQGSGNSSNDMINPAGAAAGSIGGRETYASLRARCGAEGLPPLYDICARIGAGVGSSDTQGRDSFSSSSNSNSGISSSRPSTAMSQRISEAFTLNSLSSRPSTAMSARPSTAMSGRPSISSLMPAREVLAPVKERSSMGSVGLPTGSLKQGRTTSLRNLLARKRETV